MREYIKYDIHNGRIHLKCAIMNVLNELKEGNDTEYSFDCDMPLDLIKSCCIESGFCFENSQDGILTFKYNNKNLIVYLNPTLFILDEAR